MVAGGNGRGGDRAAVSERTVQSARCHTVGVRGARVRCRRCANAAAVGKRASRADAAQIHAVGICVAGAAIRGSGANGTAVGQRAGYRAIYIHTVGCCTPTAGAESCGIDRAAVGQRAVHATAYIYTDGGSRIRISRGGRVDSAAIVQNPGAAQAAADADAGRSINIRTGRDGGDIDRATIGQRAS